MFAIFEGPGRQYKVSVGDVILLDRVSDDKGAEISTGTKIVFDQVLMVSSEDSDAAKVGAPYIDGAQVTAEIVEYGKDKKVFSFKKRRRHGFHKKVGHRRKYSEVIIRDIKAA